MSGSVYRLTVRAPGTRAVTVPSIVILASARPSEWIPLSRFAVCTGRQTAALVHLGVGFSTCICGLGPRSVLSDQFTRFRCQRRHCRPLLTLGARLDRARGKLHFGCYIRIFGLDFVGRLRRDGYCCGD